MIIFPKYRISEDLKKAVDLYLSKNGVDSPDAILKILGLPEDKRYGDIDAGVTVEKYRNHTHTTPNVRGCSVAFAFLYKLHRVLGCRSFLNAFKVLS